MADCEIEIVIVSGPGGHRVVTYADGKGIHSTIDYPTRDWAEMHAKEIEATANTLSRPASPDALESALDVAEGVEREASPQQKLEFLAGEVTKALKAMDRMDLNAYFAEAQKETPHEWVTTLMLMHDFLRPALNVLGMDYHKE